MGIKECDVLALKLAYILLKYYKYHFVFVIDDEKNIWLSNPRNDSYSLIRISNGSSGESFFKRENIDETKKDIDKLLNRKVNLFEIYTNDDNNEFIQKEEDAIWSTNIKAELPAFVFEHYPLLVGAFEEISDPDKEYEKLREAINHWHNSQKVNKSKKPKLPLITWTVAVICFFVYGLSFVLNKTFNDLPAVAVVLGAYYKIFVVVLGQYWRFVTSGFVHVELWHLAVNVFSLINLGSYLEPLLGRNKYLFVLLTAIIFGNVFTFIGSGNIVANGLSGGLYGLLAVLLVFYVKSGMIKNRRLRNNVLIIMFINIMVSLAPGISFLGHLGGFIAGIVLGVVLLFDHQRTLRINTMIAGVLLVVVMIYLTVQNQNLDVLYPITDIKIADIYDKLGLNNYGTEIREKVMKFYRGE